MKKILCVLLAALLLLSGCTPGAPEETTVPETTGPEATEQTLPVQAMPDLGIGDAEGEMLWFRNSSKIRLDYTGDRRYVRYITSVDQLPDEEALKGYDEAFFQESALLVVVETVGSGSVQLEIESIHISGGTARVTLKRNMTGEEGTDDMATWMLWVEMEQGLDCEWVLEGGRKQPQGEKY